LEKKIVCFFYKKCHVPADYQQQWWGGISGKVQKALIKDQWWQWQLN